MFAAMRRASSRVSHRKAPGGKRHEGIRDYMLNFGGPLISISVTHMMLASSHAVIGSLSLLMLLVATAADAPAADIISGVPRIHDGDTLTIDEVTIRLEGIDSPETEQVCLDQQNAKWQCGIAARDNLVEHIANRPIDCTLSGSDHRRLGVCRLAGEDLNAWMVRKGWALAFIRYSRAYTAEEEQARKGQRGMWNGAFIAPWNWRDRSCETTEVLAAVKVAITAQAELCGPIDAPPGCPIKGNLRSKGGCIYFQRWNLDYPRLDMKKKPGRRWFCSEEEAQAAGCRPARR
jgi:endonuclease YncB( thermonuclease family)